MSTLYEYYITGDDGYSLFYGANWLGQTFTPSVTHKITSVKLKLFRLGSPGNITVSIRATEDGEPIGADLCSGTTNGNTLTTNSDGEWREITLGNGYDLEVDTKYAIVVRATNGDGSNKGGWRYDFSSPTYAGGTWVSSPNSGVEWTGNGNIDFMFEEWGVAAATYTKTVSMDALLRATDTEAINLDAYLKATDLKSVNLDTLLKVLGISKTVALDIILGTGILIYLDALLKGKADVPVNLDLLIQALDKQDISLDALIVARNLESISVDALLKGEATATVLLDVLLGEVFLGTASVSLDAILFKALPPSRIYTIEIRNGDGALLAILENAHGISYAQTINSPHSLTLDLPANDSKISNILLANECWLRDNRTDTIIKKFKLRHKIGMRT